MGKRILVAVILAPLFFVVLFFLEPVWLAVLMAAISALASFELLRATGVAPHNGMYFCTALAAAAIPLGEWLGQEGMVLQTSALLLMVAIFWIAIRLYDREKAVRFEDVLVCLFGGLMIPWALSTLVELKGMELALEYLSLYFVQNECCCEACALHSKVARAWQMMRDNLEQPFSISQLAKSVGMSESSLKRTFRSMYGASIFSSFQRHRMSEARKLLEESKYNVAEVAYRVGYANPSHFSRAFSRYFGVPPKECR